MDAIIDVKQVLRSKIKSKADIIPDFAIKYLIRIIHQNELNDILTKYKNLQGVNFMTAIVNYFKLNLKIINEENLPSGNQRYIFASNHPLGGLDGICLSALLGKHYEGNIKCFVNDLLLAIPNLRSIFVPINKHGAQNREAAQKAKEAYSSDSQIITFPAGLCSRKIKGKIVDLEWKKSFIQKAVEYKRDIVPIFFEGHNSNFFYRLANFRKRIGIKMNFEMLYLPDEMFKNKNQTFCVHIGKPISWQTFDKKLKSKEWAEWMKEKVYKLASN